MGRYKRLVNRINKILLSKESYAKKLGVKIGTDCIITTNLWGSEPYLIEIGNHVHVTINVSFVNHDGGVWVDRLNTSDFDVFGKIIIMDNTYIGNNAIILPGVTIGKNCVIGANSVVSKSIPDNTVCAGNPIRYITSTENYIEKMKSINAKTKKMHPKDKKIKINQLSENNLIIKPTLQNLI
jgi:acetyltransferase-like isoleucine patch superfamily enzyme